VPAGAAAVTIDQAVAFASAHTESGTGLLSFVRDLWCIFSAAHAAPLEQRHVGLWMVSNTALAILGAALYGLVLPALQGQTFALLTAAGTADGHADLAELRSNLAKLFGWICFLVGIEVAASASQIYLGVRWRRQLTARLQSDYLSSRAFYHLARRAPALDNPDQRITSDLDQCLRSICGECVSAVPAPAPRSARPAPRRPCFPPDRGCCLLHARSTHRARPHASRRLMPPGWLRPPPCRKK